VPVSPSCPDSSYSCHSYSALATVASPNNEDDTCPWFPMIIVIIIIINRAELWPKSRFRG
jgi:hypothetical protein